MVDVEIWRARVNTGFQRTLHLFLVLHGVRDADLFDPPKVGEHWCCTTKGKPSHPSAYLSTLQPTGNCIVEEQRRCTRRKYRDARRARREARAQMQN